jgi:hypothetical protein
LFLWSGRRAGSFNLLPQRPRPRRVPGPSRQCVYQRDAACALFGEPETTARVVSSFLEEEHMPVILLWAIPTVIIIGGGGYWLMHLHH